MVIHIQNWSKNLLLWFLYKITTKSEAKIYFYAFVLCLLLKVMKKCTIRTSFYFHLKSELLWPLYVFATKNEARIYYYDFYVCLLMKSEAKIYCYHFFAWLLQKMKQESTIATSWKCQIGCRTIGSQIARFALNFGWRWWPNG